MNTDLDLDNLRQWIGREEAACDVLTPALVARFEATLGGEPGDFQGGDVAPQLIHFCLCQPAVPITLLGDDGHPTRGGFLPPVPLPRRMWAASEIEFLRDLRVGEEIERRSRVVGVAAKSGRTGSLCFVEIEHVISSAGKAAVSERQTLVYREAAHRTPVAPPFAAPAQDATAVIDTSTALLFRYSALTFNSHRIHYDLPYAIDEERYPALVVQGPLQATLLVRLAARENSGNRPCRFSFRGVAPAFSGAPLNLHADTLDNGTMALWTSQGEGVVAMQATAAWR